MARNLRTCFHVFRGCKYGLVSRLCHASGLVSVKRPEQMHPLAVSKRFKVEGRYPSLPHKVTSTTPEQARKGWC